MLRVTLPSAALVGLRAGKGKLGVNVALLTDPKPAASRSPGCVVATEGVAGLFELPKTVPLVSTRLVDAMPEKSAALTSLVEYRLVENVTVTLSPACNGVATYPEPM